MAALAGYVGPRQPTSLGADVSAASKQRSPERCFPRHAAGILVPAGQPQGSREVREEGPKAGSLHWGSCARHLEPCQSSVTATSDNTGAEGATGASASRAAGVRFVPGPLRGARTLRAPPGGCGGREGGGTRPARGRPNGGPGHGAAAGGGGGAGRVRRVPQVSGGGEPGQSPAAEERGRAGSGGLEQLRKRWLPAGTGQGNNNSVSRLGVKWGQGVRCRLPEPCRGCSEHGSGCAAAGTCPEAPQGLC